MFSDTDVTFIHLLAFALFILMAWLAWVDA